MKKRLTLLPAWAGAVAGALALALACPARLWAQSVVLTGPVGSGLFGSSVTVLPTGNYVVTDPGYDNGAVPDVGAAYLYSGTTNAVLSTLVGTKANDQVGSGGVVVLANGNYLVSSPGWDNGAAYDAGAVTWASGTTGVSGAVSAANSLVGTTAQDQVGQPGIGTITTLANGNYVVGTPYWNNGAVADAGASTWGSGTAGVSGAISAANSLVGTTASDNVNAAVALPNGHYVVTSPYWDNGAATNAGAATWGSGTSGVRGTISAANSLVGTTTNDYVGNIIALPTGNYVVKSPNWDNGPVYDAGAVTWSSGTSGVSGAVSPSNSLVGTSDYDQVGLRAVVVLANGNYVVCSPSWDNGAVANAGAVTWASGTAGVSGAVSPSNSLVGTKVGDALGNAATALTNSHYVVSSPNWDNGAVRDAGASTWANGSTGLVGTVSAANSLVGTKTNDQVGTNATALTNGNYVVQSLYWSNGATPSVGAATWANGSTGLVGAVSLANSLVGSTAYDEVGYYGIVALATGNYVVCSPYWSNGAATSAGAATWASGTTGLVGTVNADNSLVGTTADDLVGGFVTPLTNGSYVVRSTPWDNGAAVNAGAATWGSGTTGVSGAVSAANSLVGTKANDAVGLAVTPLANGNYVVTSPNWDNGAVADAGAVTWGSGTTGVSGAVSAANSLVGSTAGDKVGGTSTVLAFADGSYAVSTYSWDSGAVADAGAATWGSGTGGTAGPITGCNSIVGSIAYQGGFANRPAYNPATATLLAGLPSENKVVVGVGAPPAPVGAAAQAPPAPATVASLQATGAAIRWYAAASGGAALAATTPLAPGTTYYATQTVGGCESLSRLAVTVGGTVPLPVALTTFTATAEGSAAVRLAWATASEKNSAWFEVERSLDGASFARIGTVAAAGTTATAHAYGLTDAALPAGASVLYYRLRQVDLDGTFSYSPVRVVALSTGWLALFPNPAHGGAATLTGVAAGQAVQVLDAVGRLVLSATADASGTAALALPAGLPGGVYVVRAGAQALRLTVE